MDLNQVLKHLPTSNKESEEIKLPLLNNLVLSILKENGSIGAEKSTNVSKIGYKIIPGQPILQLHDERN